jgi:hypothetical protein
MRVTVDVREGVCACPATAASRPARLRRDLVVAAFLTYGARKPVSQEDESDSQPKRSKIDAHCRFSSAREQSEPECCFARASESGRALPPTAGFMGSVVPRLVRRTRVLTVR